MLTTTLNTCSVIPGFDMESVPLLAKQYRILICAMLVLLAGCVYFLLRHESFAMDKSDDFFSKSTMNLLDSLSRGDQTGVAAAIAAGGNANEVSKHMGATPLTYSVIKQNLPAVQGLLALGANPNTRQNDRHNALTSAYELSRNAPEIFAALINSGKSDLNVIMPDDEPMVYYLAAAHKLDFLEMALKRGANPSLLTRSRLPLVIAAALVSEFDAVQLLLDAGASPFSTDGSGDSLINLVRTDPSQKISPNGVTNQSRVRLLDRLQKLGIK